MTWATTVRLATIALALAWIVASAGAPALAAGAAAGARAPQAAPAAPTAPPRAVPSWRQASRVAVVTIHGEVDEVTRASVLRRMREAVAAGADAIVLDLDTPGGDLNATLQICLAIKDDLRVPVHAWIHPRAFSAGTILALACRGILVAPNAVFGDAAPITGIPGFGLMPLPAAERAKIEAPVLAEVVDSARRGGYDETLVRTFVTVQEEAWMLRNRRTDERIFVGRQEYRHAFGEDPPATRSAGSADRGVPPGHEGALAIRPSYDDRFRGSARPAPESSPSAEDIAAREEHVNFMQLRPPARAPLAPEDAGDWELVAQVDGADELLVVYAPEARAFGLAQDVVANDGELAAWFGASTLWRLDEHWGDGLVRFLTSWPVRLILVVVLLAGFLVEISAPGLGWFGGAAAVALVLLLGAPLLAGIQSWWPVVLVGAGIALVLVEVFVTPGFGAAGFLGGGCVLIGLIAAFVDAPLATPQGQSDLTNALAIVVAGGIVAAVVAWATVRALPRTPMANAAILHATLRDSAPGDRPTRARTVEVGAVGVAVTPLRPVGRASFEGALIQVQSVGGYVDEGREVVVVRASAYAVEVEERTA
jgi:membrane-bound ClpP family serine protease